MKEAEVRDTAVAVFAVVTFVASLSRTVENTVGIAVVILLLLLGVRVFYVLVVAEWRKDRALWREVGRPEDPPPILLYREPSTDPIIIPFGHRDYPAELARRAEKPTARELGR